MDYPWRVKQRQADEHVARFAAACDEYVNAANLSLRNERNVQTGTIRVRLHADAEPPLSLGATIGDVLHNLRSALDSVAWEACLRAGVPQSREREVQFPIGTDPARWPTLAGRQLPNLSPEHLEVFRGLQPWFWDEEARAHGIEDLRSTAERHALAKLHMFARIDRHRVPHPVLARAGHNWLGHDGDVTIDFADVRYWDARPGDVVMEWRVDPPERVADVQPDGEVVMALSEEGARERQPALTELRAMQQAVVQATRAVEIGVLEVVSQADLDGLGRLEREFHDAQEAVRTLVASPHVIDADYIERRRLAADAERVAEAAYLDRWRELFE